MPPPGSSPQKPRILAAIPATGKSRALFASSAPRAACTEFMGHPLRMLGTNHWDTHSPGQGGCPREIIGTPTRRAWVGVPWMDCDWDTHAASLPSSCAKSQDLHGIARSRCENTRGDSATALRSAQNDRRGDCDWDTHAAFLPSSCAKSQDLHGIARSRRENTRGDSATTLRSAQNDRRGGLRLGHPCSIPPVILREVAVNTKDTHSPGCWGCGRLGGLAWGRFCGFPGIHERC